MRAHLVAGALLALGSVAGCSLLLDFPESSGEPLGGGGVGGGGVGGGEGGACSEGAIRGRLEVVLRAVPASNSKDSYVTTTGLVAQSSEIKMFGEAPQGIEGLSFPSSSGSNMLFAVSRATNDAPEEIGSIMPCDAVGGNLLAGRVSLLGSNLLVSAAIPAASDTLYAVNDGTEDSCPTSNERVSAANGSMGLVPFFTVMSAGVDPDIGSGGEALGLDTDFNAEGNWTAGLGVAKTAYFFQQLSTGGPEYVVARSHADQTDNVFWLTGKIASADEYPDNVLGAITIDDHENLWVTGGDCDVTIQACPDQTSLFIGAWSLSDDEKTDVPIESGARSFGTAAAQSGDRAFVGGGFEGALSIGGVKSGTAKGVGPLVTAFDTTDKSVLWVYPHEAQSASADTDAFEAVVDIVPSDVTDCGSSAPLYVVGCRAGAGASALSCTPHSASVDRQTFIIALDAATGDELFTFDLAPEQPSSNLLLPTAVAAAPDGSLFLALSLRGSLSLPSESDPITTTLGAETLVLRYRPE